MADIIQIQESEYDAILRQAVAVLPWGHTLTLKRKFGIHCEEATNSESGKCMGCNYLRTDFTLVAPL